MMAMFGFPAPPLNLLNAHGVGPDGMMIGDVRIEHGRIAALNAPRRRGEATLDLGGAFLYPGLINAHDHLELNNFTRLKWRDGYANAREWIADFQPRFHTDSALTGPLSAPLADRLFIGGIKNLLSGVTTVAHHNPLHPPLRRADFPVQVVQRYGWSHSLMIDGEEKVARAYRRTPRGWPWFIHAAEGTDADAQGELERLERLGCLGPRTVLIHGVGLRAEDRAKLIEQGGGLVWCPASNHFMLGATADVGDLARAGRVALGSDSRLSGARDLLEELKCAAQTGQAEALTLFRMVTTMAARLLNLKQAGYLALGQPADMVVLPRLSDEAYQTLLIAQRRDIQLVLMAGRPRWGAPELKMHDWKTHGFHLDGEPKWMELNLAQRLMACSIRESGVVMDP